MRTRWIAIFLILLPLAEIAGFVVVGQWVGVWSTLALVLLSGMLGMLLLRMQGLQVLRQLSEEGREGRVPGETIVHGAMIVVASLLLMIPGFITDIIGIALFIPSLRRLIWSSIGRRFVVAGSSSFRREYRYTGKQNTGSQGRVVDLDEEDFHREANPSSPWSDRKISDE
ncbi:membrane protein FxsA [Pseudorhizobium endolithicum]|uniref:Membrane protein FxsA n=1 Tax=Pseudorhizobium endolithicum TaxID=1191678 RepID=A0ABM8PUL1_9HYPH|nr:FxsA family protein [Pseudorhizobium endolithicum]CAD7049253.1 membrane protein FxsA [Pseudorhizobium endolithicum]